MPTATIQTDLPEDPGPPEWVHLVPAGTSHGVDGRGPYRLLAPQAVIAASIAGGQKLPIDENHAIQLAASAGSPSPARGWIVGMEARADGIWGRVEWTPTGVALMAEKSYRGISPVFLHDARGVVTKILGASLTNKPNLAALTTLHAALTQAEREEMPSDMFALPELRELPIRDADHVRLAWDMVDRTAGLSLAQRRQARARILARARQLGIDTRDWSGADHVATHGEEMDPTALRAALGLPETADEAAILAAVTANAATVALQAQEVGRIAAAAGVTASTEAELVTALAAQRAASAEAATLSQTVVALQTQLQTLQQDAARSRAVAFIDAAIAAGKPIVPLRDRYIARHMANAADVEAELAALPSIHAGGVVVAQQASGADGAPWLSPDEHKLARALKLSPLDYNKHRQALRAGRGETG